MLNDVNGRPIRKNRHQNSKINFLDDEEFETNIVKRSQKRRIKSYDDIKCKIFRGSDECDTMTEAECDTLQSTDSTFLTTGSTNSSFLAMGNTFPSNDSGLGSLQQTPIERLDTISLARISILD